MGTEDLLIYFFGSISGGTTQIGTLYRPMIVHIERSARVLSREIFFAPEILSGKEPGFSDEDIFQRDIGMIDRSHALIGDISSPSHGVGYEVCYAEGRGLPILALHQASSPYFPSPMIKGNARVNMRSYNDLLEAEKHITEFMNSLRGRRQ